MTIEIGKDYIYDIMRAKSLDPVNGNAFVSALVDAYNKPSENENVPEECTGYKTLISMLFYMKKVDSVDYAIFRKRIMSAANDEGNVIFSEAEQRFLSSSVQFCLMKPLAMRRYFETFSPPLAQAG